MLTLTLNEYELEEMIEKRLIPQLSPVQQECLRHVMNKEANPMGKIMKKYGITRQQFDDESAAAMTAMKTMLADHGIFSMDDVGV